ncbi:MAG: hypothetical protein M3P98_03190 [bacterium]|nr:hypothetical protein [bacterium]
MSTPEIKISEIKANPMPELIQQNPRIAFGRVVMPYFFGIDESVTEGITSANIESVSPDAFKPVLLPTASKEGRYVVGNVALDAAEYERIVRSRSAFSKKISNTTFKARSHDERREEAVDRSVVHAWESKIAAMGRTLTGIEDEKAKIASLAKEARSPGYAHVHAQELQMLSAFVLTNSINRMVDVISREKYWDADQRQVAEKAILTELFFTGNQRVGYWRAQLRLASLYAGQRRRLFDTTISRLEKNLDEETKRKEALGV